MDRCGAYKECWEYLGKPPDWQGCNLPAGHEGGHRDDTWASVEGGG